MTRRRHMKENNSLTVEIRNTNCTLGYFNKIVSKTQNIQRRNENMFMGPTLKGLTLRVRGGGRLCA